MKFIYAKNPVWANRSQTLINLTVRFEEIDEDLPFTANPNDSEAHGRDIYARAIAGEFGEINSFTAIEPTISEVANAIKLERDRRLVASDWTQLPDVPQTTRDLWESYRQALRDLPQQPNFPWCDQVAIETDLGFSIVVDNAPFPSVPR